MTDAKEAEILKRKDFPFHFPSDVLAVIDAMAFDSANVKVSGSMALRSQQYAADYDLTETVHREGSKAKAVQYFTQGLQQIVKNLLKLPDAFVGDIKCGEIAEWKIVNGDIVRGHVVGYDAAMSRSKVEELESIGVLTKSEAAEARRILVASPSVETFLHIRDLLRPHIVRWSPKDVLRGFQYLRDGRRFSLADGIQTPSLTKIDAVALVEKSRFADFSCIYSFVWRHTVLNPVRLNPQQSLKEAIVTLDGEGSYYKMAKRMFSLLRMEPRRNAALLGALTELFNGDLGRLYSIIADIQTLLYLLENEAVLPLAKVRYEIGMFRARLGNIFETGRVNTKQILEDLLGLETSSRPLLVKGLTEISERFSGILNAETAKFLKTLKLMPLGDKFRP